VKCYGLLVDTRVLSSIVGALAALVMLAFCRTLNAQHVTVLKNVNVLDGTGAAAEPHRTVVIEGDRIRSIAPEQTDTPSGAKAVDMQGRTIMPLIIDTHGHLGMVKGTSSGVANQTEDNFRHQLLRYQDYGIGAVLSMGTDGPKFAEIREASRTGKSTQPATASAQKMAHRQRRWVSLIFCGPALRKKRERRSQFRRR
jgi:imidazolonepropionase-like amidohydrolase